MQVIAAIVTTVCPAAANPIATALLAEAAAVVGVGVGMSTRVRGAIPVRDAAAAGTVKPVMAGTPAIIQCVMSVVPAMIAVSVTRRCDVSTARSNAIPIVMGVTDVRMTAVAGMIAKYIA
jgi:hypothetical protein